MSSLATCTIRTVAALSFLKLARTDIAVGSRAGSTQSASIDATQEQHTHALLGAATTAAQHTTPHCTRYHPPSAVQAISTPSRRIDCELLLVLCSLSRSSNRALPPPPKPALLLRLLHDTKRNSSTHSMATPTAEPMAMPAMAPPPRFVEPPPLLLDAAAPELLDEDS